MPDDTRPHFLLFSDSRDQWHPEAGHTGSWRFQLESLSGPERFEAGDVEPEVAGQRLALLAVVRGLEALDQPSRVTLVTGNERIRWGLRYGLDHWRENGWRWERFGKLVPIKNRDLWQRLDHALTIHQVQCRAFRFDRAHAVPEPAFHRRHSPPRVAAPRQRRLEERLAALVRLLVPRNTWRGWLDWLPLPRWVPGAHSAA
jgi:ribonuclease HI